MESKTIYFEDVLEDNTGKTFELALEKILSQGIKKVVLASTTGATAQKALDLFGPRGVQLVVIPHQSGFMRPENPFPQSLAKTLREAGHEVHFATMLFHTDGLYGVSAPTIIANVLRCFSQGVKVCFEIVLMAADAGLVADGETVLAIAGTGKGADTALVMQAATTQQMNKLHVNEILCKPL